MTCYLYHDDDCVCSLLLDADFTLKSKGDIYSQKLMPVGTLVFSKNENEPVFIKGNFREWWEGKFILDGRKNLERMMSILGIRNKRELVKSTRLMSLDDHYWIKFEGEENLKWSDVNYFSNDFSDNIGYFLLAEKAKNGSVFPSDPSFHTGGQLSKAWLCRDGKRILVKGCSSIIQQEPFNEYITSEICHRVGLKCVDYTIKSMENTDGNEDYFSVCENFTDAKTEFIPASAIIKVLPKLNHESYLQHFDKCCRFVGIKGFEEPLNKMLILDFIMANTDRHYNNFGFLRNTDTLQWLGMAPVFDTERSLFLEKSIVKNMYAAQDIEAKPFKDNQAEQFNLINKDILRGIDFKGLSDVPNIFEEILKKNRYIDENRRTALYRNLVNRIDQVKMLSEKNMTLSVTRGKHRREQDRWNSLGMIILEAGGI